LPTKSVYEKSIPNILFLRYFQVHSDWKTCKIFQRLKCFFKNQGDLFFGIFSRVYQWLVITVLRAYINLFMRYRALYRNSRIWYSVYVGAAYLFLICSVPRTNFIAKCKIFRVLLELILRYLFKPRNLAITYYRGQMAFDLETTIKVLRLN